MSRAIDAAMARMPSAADAPATAASTWLRMA
jgi:hypothetical protein